MAIPPRRWVGYSFLAAGLLLLFDTLTFLRTNWSPLHVPMFAGNELALGYLSAVTGVMLLLAPTLIRILDRYAPDASMKTGAELAHQSVQNHVKGRLPRSAKSLFIRKAISWIIVALGLLLGFLDLSISGGAWLPNRAGDPYWYKPLIGIAGFIFLGLTLVAGSLFATRDRRRAGLIFLIVTPIIAFCMSFPDVGYLAWVKGDGIFYSPFLRIALGLSLLFFVPFVVPLFARQNKKRALYLFLISAVVVTPVFVSSQWSASLLPRLAGWSVPTVVLGLFWLGTEAFGWVPLVEPQKRSPIGRVLAIVAACLLIAGTDVVTTLVFTAWQSSTYSPDCGGRGLFTQPVFPGHAVFTARLVRTGHSTRAVGDSTKWAGSWAVGIVQEKFWGVPSVWPRLVLLTNDIFWEGETYFVDGRRAHGFLTGFLPVIEAGPCSRTRSVVDATVDLRILREKSVPTGARIVGFVQQPEPFRPWPSPPAPHTPLAGARIDFAGSSGTRVVTADQDGIYEIDDLQPDNYTVTLELQDTQTAREQAGREKIRQQIGKEELIHQKVIERDFHVVWNGTIEGSVRETTGNPAQVWVSVLNPDGTDTVPQVMGSQQTDKSGSFSLTQIPRGQYKLMVNPYGPDKESPYPPMYYPSADRLSDAQIFEIADGQQLHHVDFILPRLAQKKTEVHVTWPDGHGVIDGAWVYVAYENTKGFEKLIDAAHVAIADKNGQASFAVFGKSRIRIFAEESVSDLKGPPFISSRYSVPAEFEADQVPDKLNIVLTKKTLPGEP
jgi:hypothetical protein